MISIRLWFEVPSPSGKGMERLPVLPGEFVVAGIDQIFTATVEEVNVDGQTLQVEGIGDPRALGRVRLSLVGATNDLTDGAVKTLIVDIVQQSGEQPGK